MRLLLDDTLEVSSVRQLQDDSHNTAESKSDHNSQASVYHSISAQARKACDKQHSAGSSNSPMKAEANAATRDETLEYLNINDLTIECAFHDSRQNSMKHARPFLRPSRRKDQTKNQSELG